MATDAELRIGAAVYQGLTLIAPDTLQPLPGCAEAWSSDAEGMALEFHLRAGAVWSDGTGITAHDFARGFRRLLNPATEAPFGYLFDCLRGARALRLYGIYSERIIGPAPHGRPTLLQALSSLTDGFTHAVTGESWKHLVFDHELSDMRNDVSDPRLREALHHTHDEDLDVNAAKMLHASLRDFGTRLRAEHMKARDAFGRSMGVYAKDAKTLVIELDRPHPNLLSLLALPCAAPLPADPPLRDGVFDWFRAAASGPMRVVDRASGGRIRLERNMSYWNAEGVKLDAAELIPVEPSAAIRMFQRGELDVVFGLPAEAASKLDGDPRLFGSATQAVYYFVLNTTSPALRDVRVRRALAAALDREAVVAAHPGARNLVAHRVVPPGMIGYTAPDVQLSGDPAAARRLAEAALDQEGRRGTLRLIFNASDTHRRVASIAASGWSERLGLSVRPVALEWLQYLRSRRTGEYEIARWGWVPDYVDPAAFLELWTSDSSENDTNWANARYDRLLSMARQSLALPAERMRLLAEAEAILLREVPVIPVFYYSRAALVAVRVRGFHTRVTDPDSVGVTNPMGWNPLQAMSLVE